MIGVNRSTARGIVARYMREGRVAERQRGGSVRVDEEMKECLRMKTREMKECLSEPLCFHPRMQLQYMDCQKPRKSQNRRLGVNTSMRAKRASWYRGTCHFSNQWPRIPFSNYRWYEYTEVQ